MSEDKPIPVAKFQEAWLDRVKNWISGDAAKWGAGIILLILLLYYPVGMIVIHKVDANPDLKIDAGAAGSQAVAATILLINRETNENRWTPNDPWFLPGAALDNMPNFQQGIIYALSRFSIEMLDQIGRVRGSSQVDPNLEKAAGSLKFQGDMWYFDISRSWVPTTPSEQHYRAAARELKTYNDRLAVGTATFERRADNLQATLERITADIGSASAVIHTKIEDQPWIFDFNSDDVFYQTKGRLYGYLLILRGLGQDFRKVIQERELTAAWEQMLQSLHAAMQLDPVVVANGEPDGSIVPNHLAAQGFYLLRARTQLKEISNILLK